jgi:HAMP domain-containing protein
MTQISPKPSKNDINGRIPPTKMIQIEGGTTGIPIPTAYQTGVTEAGLLVPKAPLAERKREGWRWSSLRTKATVLAIALGTVPVLLTGVTAYFFADQSISNQINTTKIQRAVGLEDKLKRFMRERYGDIQIMAGRNFLTTAFFRDKLTAAEKEEQLNSLVEAYKVYDLISVADLKGNVILQSKSDPLPNQSDREYFQQVLKTDKPYISNATIPQVSNTPEQPAINLAAPIKDKTTGQTIAIIRARIPVSNFADNVANFGTEGDEFYVIDNSIEKIFISSVKGKDFKEALPIFPGLSKLQAQNKPSALVFNDQVDKKEKVFASTKFGELEGLPTLDWQAVIATPTDIAFAPQAQLFLAITIGTFVTAVLVSAIAVFLTNRTVRPLLSAAGAVDKIGQGQLDTRLEIQGEDEIAELGANINVMAEQLQIFVQEQTLAAERAILLTKVTGSRALSSQELNNLFGEILDDARKNLEVDRVVIYRFTADRDGEIVAESVGRGWPSALITKIDHSLISDEQIKASLEGRVDPINNIREANLAPEQLRIMERLEIKASVEVAILNEGRP